MIEIENKFKNVHKFENSSQNLKKDHGFKMS